MSEMFTLKDRVWREGPREGPKRNETVRSTFPVIAIQFPFQPAACATCRPANPRGNGLKQFLRSKQIFYRCIPKPVCTFEREFYFGVSLLERGRGGIENKRGDRNSLPAPCPLPFTIGQRTVLKWIPIFQGVDLIKRGPDFHDGNIPGEMDEN